MIVLRSDVTIKDFEKLKKKVSELFLKIGSRWLFSFKWNLEEVTKLANLWGSFSIKLRVKRNK